MTATIQNHIHTDIRNPTQRYKKGKVQFMPQSLHTHTHTHSSHAEQSVLTHSLSPFLSLSLVTYKRTGCDKTIHAIFSRPQV